MNKKITIVTLSTFVLALSVTSIQAKIYKWTDANGSVHYSATPPKQSIKSKVKVKDIENKIRSAAGKPSLRSKSTDEKNEKNTAKNDDKLAPPSKKLIKYCKAQRSNLRQLKDNFNTTWVEPNGKQALLTQKQRKDKVKEIRKSIKTECAGV